MLSKQWLPVNLADAVSWEYPLCKNIVAWYQVLPGMTGGLNWFDLTKRYNGTLTNMTPSTAWSAEAPSGGLGSVEFRGAGFNDVVALSAGGIVFPLSISTVVRFASFGENGRIIASNVFTDFELGHLTTGQLFIYVSGSLKSTGFFASIGRWYHIQVTATSSGALELLVDGQSVYTTTSTPPPAISSWQLGKSVAGSSIRLNGNLSSVLISKSLDSTYQQSLLGYPDMLRRIPRRRSVPVAAGGLESGLIDGKLLKGLLLRGGALIGG